MAPVRTATALTHTTIGAHGVDDDARVSEAEEREGNHSDEQDVEYRYVRAKEGLEVFLGNTDKGGPGFEPISIIEKVTGRLSRGERCGLVRCL